MTNPAFSYDPETNIVEVNPGSEPQQDGEMIITWKSQKGSFNTKPITRKISLHWDNLRDGYYIAFQTNGGSVVDAIISKYNKKKLQSLEILLNRAIHLQAGIQMKHLQRNILFRQ